MVHSIPIRCKQSQPVSVRFTAQELSLYVVRKMLGNEHRIALLTSHTACPRVQGGGIIAFFLLKKGCFQKVFGILG